MNVQMLCHHECFYRCAMPRECLTPVKLLRLLPMSVLFHVWVEVPAGFARPMGKTCSLQALL